MGGVDSEFRVTHKLCDLGQVTQLLCSSVFHLENRDDNSTYLKGSL